MTIAVDFDGTIVSNEYPRIGKPIPFAIEALKRLQIEDHHELILWTCREGRLLQEAIDYCQERGLDFYAINSNFPEEAVIESTAPRKITADLFIDDRNLGGIPDWGIIYQMVHNGQQSSANWGHAPLTEVPKRKKRSGILGQLFSKE